MTDIIERLRATDGTLAITTILDRCMEAAAEIERLQTDSRDWERMSEKHRAEWVRTAQERDKMKAACQMMIDGRWDAACKAARAALGGKP